MYKGIEVNGVHFRSGSLFGLLLMVLLVLVLSIINDNLKVCVFLLVFDVHYRSGSLFGPLVVLLVLVLSISQSESLHLSNACSHTVQVVYLYSFYVFRCASISCTDDRHSRAH